MTDACVPADPVRLRRGRAEDAPDLAALHVGVWRATYRDLATPEALERLDEAKRLPYWRAALAITEPDHGVWVAETDSKIAGVVSAAPADHPAFEGRLEIKHLYVCTTAQGQGIGARLLKAVLTAAQRPVALAVVRQNAIARAFYAKAGGQEIGAFTDPGPLWRSDNIVVAWDATDGAAAV